MDNQNENASKSLATFGLRDDIREMADRLTRMMPGVTKLTQQEALTVAQVAVAHGLDPFTGEVWGLKSKSGDWYGCMIGIAGRRKKAREQAEKEGGIYWTETPARVEPKMYSQAESAVVYEIRLRDTVTTQAYAKSLHSLTTAGIPYQDAVKMLGNAPVCVGVGIATPDEQSKMGVHARAKKRAEADALKQRYDIHLVGIDFSEGEEIPQDAYMPDVVDVVATELPTKTATTKSESELMSELGFSALVAQIVDYSALPEAIREMTNSESVKYIDLPTEELNVRAYSMAKKLKENGLSEEYKANTAAKLEAVRAILKVRNA